MKKINEAKLLNHLNNKWKNGCPMCNSCNWGVHNSLEAYVPIDLVTDTVKYGSTEVFPVLLVKCADCGFIAQISPVIAGVLEEA